MNLFLTLKLKYQQKNTVLNIESLGLSPQRQQSNRLKKTEQKEIIQMYLVLDVKLLFFFI